MKIEISNVNMRYENGELATVQVQFNGATENRNLHVTGTLPLDASEYEGNETVADLVGKVKEYINGQLESN